LTEKCQFNECETFDQENISEYMIDQAGIYESGPVNYWRALGMRRVPGAYTQLRSFTSSKVLTAVAINILVFLDTMQCIQRYAGTNVTEESSDPIFRIWQSSVALQMKAVRSFKPLVPM